MNKYVICHLLYIFDKLFIIICVYKIQIFYNNCDIIKSKFYIYII